MKKIILAIAAIVITLGGYAQSNSSTNTNDPNGKLNNTNQTGTNPNSTNPNGTINPNGTNPNGTNPNGTINPNGTNQNENINNTQNHEMNNNTNHDMNNNANHNMQNNNSMGDSSGMHYRQRNNMQDTMHTIKPVQPNKAASPIRAVPAQKPVQSKSNVKVKDNNGYLVPDSTLKKGH